MLSYPNFSKKFVLTGDASNNHEKNYSTIEKELLAILWAVKYFRPYLFGIKFLVSTYHQPLKCLASLKEPNSELSRWKIMLAGYEFDIEYVKGRDNKVADFLRRLESNNEAT